jgi:hypothetical protein
MLSCFICLFISILRIKPRAGYMLGKHFITWATHVHFYFVLNRVLLTFPGLALNLRSSCLYLPSNWDYRGTPPCLIYTFILEMVVAKVASASSH